MTRTTVAVLAVAALAAAGTSSSCPPPVTTVPTSTAGVIEPHTPGPGSPAATPPIVSQLLGDDADLNRVTYFRTFVDDPDAAPPRAILILIPGFLGGGTTFDPLARQLVERMGGTLEVWAIDRRPNALEDRLGGLHAYEGALDGDPYAITEGAQFYFADVDAAPTGDFPGAGDLDVDLDGVLDPRLPLQDPLGPPGTTRGPLVLSQDDARPFMAHWGVDLYMRDWKILVDAARDVVGESGIVLMGGHSQGTTWSTTFAAYDFDPTAGVDPGYAHIDGLVLLEGGGVGPGSATVGLSTGDVPRPTSPAEYQAIVAQLETPGGPDVFLSDFFGITLRDLGTSGEVAAVAAAFLPDERSIAQRTPLFGAGLTGMLLSTPATNRAVVGLFLDDDFSPIGAFRASMGFTDDGPNQFLNIPGIGSFYATLPAPGGALRTWRGFDDPNLPTCPPSTFNVSPGCAILDNGPPSGSGESPRANGVEAEVTAVQDFIATQFGKANGFEWYFVAGRVSLDFSYGNDSSSLGDESLLAITQNANVDIPVIAIGGSNGLAPEAKSFDRYLDSIATPPEDRRALILEGYAHVDVTTARRNAAVAPIADFASEILRRRLLESF